MIPAPSLGQRDPGRDLDIVLERVNGPAPNGASVIAKLKFPRQGLVPMSGLTKYAALLLLIISCGCLTVEGQEGTGVTRGFADRFFPRLDEIETRLRQIDGELRKLPVMSDIDAGGTHGFHSNFSLKSEEHWFEMRWKDPQTIDGIAMIPTRITTQSGLRSN